MRKSIFISLWMILCCTICFFGSTYAWFSSNVETGISRVEAGILDIDLLMYKDGQYQSIVTTSNSTGNIFNLVDDGYFEPNKTKIAYLKVVNLGNLALKYDFEIEYKDLGLADALEFAYISNVQNTRAYTSWDDIVNDVSESHMIEAHVSGNKYGTIEFYTQGITPEGNKIMKYFSSGQNKDNILLKQNDEAYFAIAIHMREDASIEYMNKELLLDIRIKAKQVVEIKDDNEYTYDEFATYDYDQMYISFQKREMIDNSFRCETIYNSIPISFTCFKDAISSFDTDSEYTPYGAEFIRVRDIEHADLVVTKEDGSIIYLQINIGNLRYLQIIFGNSYSKYAHYFKNALVEKSPHTTKNLSVTTWDHTPDYPLYSVMINNN